MFCSLFRYQDFSQLCYLKFADFSDEWGADAGFWLMLRNFQESLVNKEDEDDEEEDEEEDGVYLESPLRGALNPRKEEEGEEEEERQTERASYFPPYCQQSPLLFSSVWFLNNGGGWFTEGRGANSSYAHGMLDLLRYHPLKEVFVIIIGLDSHLPLLFLLM